MNSVEAPGSQLGRTLASMERGDGEWLERLSEKVLPGEFRKIEGLKDPSCHLDGQESASEALAIWAWHEGAGVRWLSALRQALEALDFHGEPSLARCFLARIGEGLLESSIDWVDGQALGRGAEGVSHCALSQEEFAELSKALAEPCAENAAEAARAIFDASEQRLGLWLSEDESLGSTTAVGFLNDFSFIPGFDEDLAAWALRLDGKIAWPKRVLGGCLSVAAGKAESSAWDTIEEIPWTLVAKAAELAAEKESEKFPWGALLACACRRLLPALRGRLDLNPEMSIRLLRTLASLEGDAAWRWGAAVRSGCLAAAAALEEMEMASASEGAVGAAAGRREPL